MQENTLGVPQVGNSKIWQYGVQKISMEVKKKKLRKPVTWKYYNQLSIPTFKDSINQKMKEYSD